MGVHHGVNSSKVLRDPESCMKWCVSEDEFKGNSKDLKIALRNCNSICKPNLGSLKPDIRSCAGLEISGLSCFNPSCYCACAKVITDTFSKKSSLKKGRVKTRSTADLRSRTAPYISLSSHKIWFTKMNPD